MNEFQKEIREKERLFKARIRELEKVKAANKVKDKYAAYIGQKFGTKKVCDIQIIRDYVPNKTKKRTRVYFVWKCNCGVEGKSQYDQLLRRKPKCMHKDK